MKYKWLLCGWLMAGWLVTGGTAQSVSAQQAGAAHDLYAQATSTMLEKDFPSPRIEYLVLDLPTRQTVASRWNDAAQPIPVGSLLKPFVALAYASSHTGRFPVEHCSGSSDRCWRTGGHGSLGLEQALARSCNAYFLALARGVTESDLARVSAEYGLPLPPAIGGDAMRIGATPEWRMTPVTLAMAYAQLASQAGSGQSGVNQDDEDTTRVKILAGMRLAALPGGTASKAGTHVGGLLAKTGTAPCVTDCVANGDGLVVLIAPAEAPHLLLLVRERGTTGAQTAQVAGEILSKLQAKPDAGRSGSEARHGQQP